MMSKTIPQEKTEQLNLFKESDLQFSSKNGASGFQDPAFASNKTLPVHRWVPWIAGFASDFVRDALNRYLSKSGMVIDPFSGVGTTLVEAIMTGHNAIGFEINPYAALACRVKINACRYDDRVLSDELAKFENFYAEALSKNYTPRTTPPKGFKTRDPFYSPDVLHKVLVTQDFIEGIKNDGIQDLFRLAFASTMVRYSNYSYEPSLGRRVTSGKLEILDFPVVETIQEKLRQMIDDIIWTKTHAPKSRKKAKVFNKSFFNFRKILDASCADLLITSPPYLNNYHYNRNTRPQLYWLGYTSKPSDFQSLEEANFGKYWQTVREQERLDLLPVLQDTPIAERLEQIRQLNVDRGVYGGNGWANYAAAYFNDCYVFAEAIKYVLKPRARALIVIGNSILQGIHIPTDEYLAMIAESLGLEVVQVDIPRKTRVGNSIIQSEARVAKAHASHQLYEAVVELRK